MNAFESVVGLVALFVGLLISIALHEVGHLVPAKKFGVKVTQYMVGFGSTVWSRQRGETEYGFKAIPAGGYIRMIGMLPPRPGDQPGQLRVATTGAFQSLVEDARTASLQEITIEDEHRVFYAKPWWQRVIIMMGGPVMNLLIAFVLFGVLIMGFGSSTLTTTVSSVSECVLPLASSARDCGPSDTQTPAAEAGFQPGDTLVSFDGVPVTDWEDDVVPAIRSNGGNTVVVVVDREGELVELTPTLIVTDRYATAGDACSEVVQTGFLGISPGQELTRKGPDVVVVTTWDALTKTAEAITGIPQKMVGVAKAAVGGERDICGPIGVVGVGRIGGEVVAADTLTVTEKVATLLYILAALNVALFVFNMIPLLPLDGGHVAGALWEGIRNGYARMRGRPSPGPVDVAKALPLAYACAIALIAMSLLLLYADVVNPIRLAG